MTTTTIASATLALILAALAVTAADARTRHNDNPTHPSSSRPIGDHRFEDYGPIKTAGFLHRAARQARHHRVQSHRQVKTANRIKYAAHVAAAREVQLLPHPVGCPARSFCGCGAALEVFGRNIRELWLARNWFRFPPASPAPGMVAVRRHHVFVIREVRGPGMVLAYDANSGGRKTRIHLRSLAGYSVRDPRAAARYATAG